MSKKNTKRLQPRRWRVGVGRRRYLLVGSVGLIAVLGLVTMAHVVEPHARGVAVLLTPAAAVAATG
jgi:hypothetical protein